MGNRQPYGGKEIKTQGYYYCIDTVNSGPVHKPRKEVVARIYFFYRNGVLYNSNLIFSGFESLEDLFKDKNFVSRFKEVPYGWGIYLIENGRIKVEAWAPSTGGKHPNFMYNLDVLSDTILYNSYRDNTFFYKSFDLKPDSVNKFTE